MLLFVCMRILKIFCNVRPNYLKPFNTAITDHQKSCLHDLFYWIASEEQKVWSDLLFEKLRKGWQDMEAVSVMTQQFFRLNSDEQGYIIFY